MEKAITITCQSFAREGKGEFKTCNTFEIRKGLDCCLVWWNSNNLCANFHLTEIVLIKILCHVYGGDYTPVRNKYRKSLPLMQ